MKIKILPMTPKAKIALILALADIILFVIGSVLPTEINYTGVEIIKHNPLQAIITIMVFLVGVGAFILGLISVIKNKERSVIAFIVILIGVYNILSFVGVIINLFFS